MAHERTKFMLSLAKKAFENEKIDNTDMQELWVYIFFHLPDLSYIYSHLKRHKGSFMLELR